MAAHIHTELPHAERVLASTVSHPSEESGHVHEQECCGGEQGKCESAIEEAAGAGPRGAGVRSDSYSSVKEDVGGFPQSFFVSSKRKPYDATECNYGDDSVFLDDFPAEGGESNLPAKSPFEKLPIELLEPIIRELTVDLPAWEHAPRNRDLISCLLTSSTVYGAVLNILYRQVTLTHSIVFAKFASVVGKYPTLGSLVRRLDLSHFTSLGFGRTRKSNQEIQHFTSASFLKCLDGMPNLKELLLQEHVDQDLDQHVLEKIFYEMPLLEALDFCASSNTSFVAAFGAATTRLRNNPRLAINIRRLCLHECFTIESKDLEILVSRLPKLTVLDVHHTRITDKALASIPRSAKFSHLNLGRCASISGPGVVEFLKNHPGTRELVYLNLACDVSRYRLLGESDVDSLLPMLTTTLRSLSLSGAKIESRHMSSLLPLTKHLEELSLGYAELSLQDICAIFQPADGETASPSTKSTLRYLDLSGIMSVTQPSLFAHAKTLLCPASAPLEVLELSNKVGNTLQGTKNANKQHGWTMKEFGRRSWYVREPVAGQNGTQGLRAWKLGSKWWGMRKVPVAWSEVGGIYGHYMFKT